MIGFRLDANEVIATGHMMRCLAIAHKCRELGCESVFLLAEDKNTDILKLHGFKYHILDIDWNNWNCGVEKVIKCIDVYDIGCLVVDSYQVTEEFFKKVYEKTKVFYIDDICNKIYNVDATLHYSEWENEHYIKDLYAGTNVITYSGMQYVPLRDEFSAKKQGNENRNQIMITTGGTDPYHMTLEIVKVMLMDDFFDKYNLCTVLGKMNTDKDSLDNMAQVHNNLFVMQNISNMGEVMRKSLVAVTAGGSTIYELFASGVPIVCFGFADNQLSFGKALDERSVGKWTGDARDNKTKVINNIIDGVKDYLVDNPEDVSARVKRIVDGQGAMRIAEIVTKLCES